METTTANQIQPMSTESLMKKCPNYFNDTPCEKRSDKYKVINLSKDVVPLLEAKGWFIRDAGRPNSKDGEKSSFMLRLANHKFCNDDRAKEILIYSSHNGRKALKFRMGILEFACSNGLVVGKKFSKELEKIKIHHKGELDKKLTRVMEIIAEETIKLDSLINGMKLRILTPQEQRELALESLKIREVPMTSEFDMELAIKTCLQTAVDVDGNPINTQEGDSLFNVFQRIQGNITKGRVKYRKNSSVLKLQKKFEQALENGDNKLQNAIAKQLANKEKKGATHRKISEIKGIDRLTKFNQQVFDLATSLV